MSLNERTIAITEEVNGLLSKDSPISSQDFIKLAASVMNFSDLSLKLEIMEQEDRKDVEYEWIWKENLI